jgi:hypothetical protein
MARKARKTEIDALRKKRDIVKAYVDKEGTVRALIKRFHASSRTVQAAIRHDVAWWQDRIAEASAGGAIVPPRAASKASTRCWVLSLVYYPNTKAYQVKTAAGEPVAMVEGTIDDVLGHLAAEGWEVIQLVPGGGGWSDVVVRRGQEGRRTVSKG